MARLRYTKLPSLIRNAMVKEVLVRVAGHDDQTTTFSYCTHGTILNISKRSHNVNHWDATLFSFVAKVIPRMPAENDGIRYQNSTLLSVTFVVQITYI